MKLLQVCNVGDICGGTAACAWSITRALPGASHAVLFLSPPTPATRAAFRDCEVHTARTVTCSLVRSIDPDVLLLHNVAGGRVEAVRAPLIVQYLHSRTDPAPADVTVACSRWLRDQFPADSVDGVLYQPVHVEPAEIPARPRGLPDRLVIGRLCTPTRRKWPPETIALTAGLAARFPQAEWEFVGCPADSQRDLRAACRGRAAFHPAGPNARRHLQEWDVLLYHHPRLTESFGRTVAEALQAGCIPVVDARGGFREQVDAHTGFLCSSLDDFAEALAQLRDASGRWRMSRAARAAGQRFCGPAFEARFRRLLEASLAALD